MAAGFFTPEIMPTGMTKILMSCNQAFNDINGNAAYTRHFERY